MNKVIPFQYKLESALHLFVFLLLLVGFNSCQSSTSSNTGSTEPKINKELSDKIHQLIYEDPLAAREMSFKLLDSLGEKDLATKVMLLKHIGSTYVLITDYTNAIKYYTQALTLAEEIHFYFEIANINNNLGMIFNEIGNAKTAYSYYFIALDNYDLAKKPDKKIGTLNNIGVMFLNMNNKDKALPYFKKALDSIVPKKDIILEASILNNLAMCYAEKYPDLAFKNLNKAIQLSEKVNNQYSLCISYQTMGNTFLEVGQNQQALDAYSESLKIAKEASLPYQEAISKMGLAKVLLNMGKTKEALTIGFEVLTIAEKNNSLVLKSQVHQLLSDIYDENEDYKNSLINFRKHVEDLQKLEDETAISQIYDVEVNHLNQQNKLQSLELETKELVISKKNNLLLFVSLSFILGLGGLYLVYRNHRHKQNLKFQKTIIELNKKKAKAALEAEFHERKRIGTELHDSIGYMLSLAGLQLSVLQKRKELTEEKKKELLNSLTDSIEDAFDEVRNISHNLSPSLLSEHGLKGALKNISAKVNQSANLKMHFDTFGLDTKMDELVENVLYRTIQEIVNNTIKHSTAKKLFIQLVQDNKQITLMAEDDGTGFDVNEMWKSYGFGLSHIKSGIENLNGTLFIDSKKQRGTIISIFIPLQN